MGKESEHFFFTSWNHVGCIFPLLLPNLFVGCIYVVLHCGLFISMAISIYSIVCITPQFIYHLYCWYTFELFPDFGHYKEWHNEHTSTYTLVWKIYTFLSDKFFSKPCVFLLECQYAFWNNIARDSERCFYFFVHVEKAQGVCITQAVAEVQTARGPH